MNSQRSKAPLAVLQCRRRRGFSLVEIICAIGFLAVFTTGLLAIATKAFSLSEKQIDMAAVFQYAESKMEEITLKSRDPDQWNAMSPVPVTFTEQSTSTAGTTVQDKRFVYTVEFDNLDTDLRLITVKVFQASSDPATPAINTSAPRGGELIRMTNLCQKEVNGEFASPQGAQPDRSDPFDGSDADATLGLLRGSRDAAALSNRQ